MTKPDLAATPDDPAATVRHLMRQCLTAGFSTLDIKGAPFGSLVLVAHDLDATPLLLMSTLAGHTRNADRDPRVSLLYDGTKALDVPMTGARVTLTGSLSRIDPADVHLARQRDRFLRRHEDATLYADFGDFSFFRLTIDVAHLVSGFGSVSRVAGRDLVTACLFQEDLEAEEADILAHMNADHRDTLDNMARHFCGHDGVGWQMTGLDADGLDLRLGGAVARVDFPEKLSETGQVRPLLVNLAKISKNTV